MNQNRNASTEKNISKGFLLSRIRVLEHVFAKVVDMVQIINTNFVGATQTWTNSTTIAFFFKWNRTNFIFGAWISKWRPKAQIFCRRALSFLWSFKYVLKLARTVLNRTSKIVFNSQLVKPRKDRLETHLEPFTKKTRLDHQSLYTI